MDIWEYAISLEQDGEKYYREQAEINKNNSLHEVCLILANEENRHAQLLIQRMNEVPVELIEEDSLFKSERIFKDIDNFKMNGKDIPSQLDFYRFAKEKEEQSIRLYTNYLSQDINSYEKELVKYLIHQEQKHAEILDELALLLRNGEEWVESAEFGNRKEY